MSLPLLLLWCRASSHGGSFYSFDSPCFRKLGRVAPCQGASGADFIVHITENFSVDYRSRRTWNRPH